jgi:hypothetical protein
LPLSALNREANALKRPSCAQVFGIRVCCDSAHVEMAEGMRNKLPQHPAPDSPWRRCCHGDLDFNAGEQAEEQRPARDFILMEKADRLAVMRDDPAGNKPIQDRHNVRVGLENEAPDHVH